MTGVLPHAVMLQTPSPTSATSSSSSPDSCTLLENVFPVDENLKVTIRRRLYPESAAAYRTWLRTVPSFKLHVRVPKRLAPRKFERAWECCSGCHCTGVEEMDLSTDPMEGFETDENGMYRFWAMCGGS
jgi:hypothetical protein